MARRAVLRPVTGPGSIPSFVAYYRVSTDKQGRSGLGLEAQREAVARHVQSVNGLIVAETQKVASGKRPGRPQLLAESKGRADRLIKLDEYPASNALECIATQDPTPVHIRFWFRDATQPRLRADFQEMEAVINRPLRLRRSPFYPRIGTASDAPA